MTAHSARGYAADMAASHGHPVERLPAPACARIVLACAVGGWAAVALVWWAVASLVG